MMGLKLNHVSERGPRFSNCASLVISRCVANIVYPEIDIAAFDGN